MNKKRRWSNKRPIPISRWNSLLNHPDSDITSTARFMILAPTKRLKLNKRKKLISKD